MSKIYLGMKMLVKKVAMASAVCWALSGCATILNDSNQTVNISASSGKPFEGTVNGMVFKAPSPVSVLRSKEDLRISTSTPGCAPLTVAANKVDNMFWINIISGGVFGSTTDYASGEMWAYEENIVVSCTE